MGKRPAEVESFVGNMGSIAKRARQKILLINGGQHLCGASLECPVVTFPYATLLENSLSDCGCSTAGWPRAVARSPAPTERSVQISRTTPKRPTTMKESPISAPQGHGPFGPSSSSLFGIQPVRLTTRRGKAEILAIVALDRMNQESRNRTDGTCPMPLIVKGTQDG